MPNHQRLTMIGIMLSLIVCSALPVSATSPEIGVNRESLDLGDVEEGQIAHAQFFVKNSGDARLIIREIRTSCGCTAAVGSTSDIAPGQKAEIAVTYDSTGLTPGRKTQSVIVESNDLRNPVTKVQVFAHVIHRVSVEPSSLVAKLSRFQEHMSFPVTLKNDSQQPVTINMSSCRGSISKAILEPAAVTLDPNSEARVSIRLDLAIPEKGRVMSGSLSLATDHPSAKRVDVRLMIRLESD